MAEKEPEYVGTKTQRETQRDKTSPDADKDKPIDSKEKAKDQKDVKQRFEKEVKEKEDNANDVFPQADDDLKKLGEKLVKNVERYEKAQARAVEQESQDEPELLNLRREKRAKRVSELEAVLTEINRRLRKLIDYNL